MTAEEFKLKLFPVKNKLYRLAFTLLSNREEAEDAVQEVYLKMWHMRNDLSKYKSTEALMVTITRNHCLDKLKSKRNRAVTLDENLNSPVHQEVDKQSEHADLLQKIRQVMMKLPEQQKTVIHLRDIEGYNYEEIVKITGFDLNYVRVNISRGRKKIRETIEKLQQYDNSRA